MPNRPIGVFDSGLGGLSVLREIAAQLPHEDLIYVADSAHAPYGAKSTQYIIQRCLAISEFLLTQEIKLLVVACNTATAHAVEVLRSQLSIPIVGLEPAVKPAVKLTQTGVIGVLATQQTAQSERLNRLISAHAKGAEVVVQACPGLVEHVESGDFDSPVLQALLQTYLAPLQEREVDTLVLGCTHYPFLKDILQQLTAGKMRIVETSIPVTKQITSVLSQVQLLNNQQTTRHVQFYSSSMNHLRQSSAKYLWQGELLWQPLPTDFV